MAAEAEAAREARAKVIAAEGEQKASRALREASEVISESPSALQVINTFHRELSQSKSDFVVWLLLLFLQINVAVFPPTTTIVAVDE